MLNNYSRLERDGMRSKKEIKDMLHNYQWMIQTIALKRSELEDAGQSVTTQYGIEASLPKPKGTTSDPLYFEVLRREKKHDSIRKLEEKVLFIQKYSKAIKDEKQRMVLDKILDGRSMRSISRFTNIPLSNVARIRDEIISLMHTKQMEQTEHLEQSVHS